MWGFAPILRQLGNDLGFVPFVIGASVVLYLLSLAASGSSIGFRGLDILSPSTSALVRFGASGAIPVFAYGGWWTVLSATWLHGSLLHILFNMMWVRDLGPQAAAIVGPARTIIIYVVSGACGFLLSSAMGYYAFDIPFLSGARLTVGASASIFGLLGAMVHYGRVSGSSYIHAEAMRYAVILFVFGLVMRGVDNYAHAGGFIGGYAVSMFFNPLTKERGDHMLIAVACLVASLLAVGTSFWSAL